MHDKEAIAERLRRFGEARFATMRAFAAALEISPSALNTSYLSGRSAPGAGVLVRLIDLGADIRWLLVGDGFPPAPTIEELRLWMEVERQWLEMWETYLKALEDARDNLGLDLHGSAYRGIMENVYSLLEDDKQAAGELDAAERSLRVMRAINGLMKK